VQNCRRESENLNQANKLSRTYATLLEALDHHRVKGQQMNICRDILSTVVISAILRSPALTPTFAPDPHGIGGTSLRWRYFQHSS
jgi:hypothetical protein